MYLEGFQVIWIFPSKSYVLDNSESVEKLLKKHVGFHKKNRVFRTDGGVGSEIYEKVTCS